MHVTWLHTLAAFCRSVRRIVCGGDPIQPSVRSTTSLMLIDFTLKHISDRMHTSGHESVPGFCVVGPVLGCGFGESAVGSRYSEPNRTIVERTHAHAHTLNRTELRTVTGTFTHKGRAEDGLAETDA